MIKNIEKELSSEETLEKKLNVKLHTNSLDKESESYYASVNSQTASVKVALSNIKEEDKGIEISGLKRGLELYNRQVLKLLSQGYSVKVMDLGILRIKHRGKIEADNKENGFSNFTVEFEVASDVVKAVESLDVDEVLMTSSAPAIESIVDLKRKVSDGKVTLENPIAAKGKNLKLNEADEVYLIPQTEYGTDEADTSKWVKIEYESVFRNKPTELNIFLPEGLEKGKKFKLEIVSRYNSKGTLRKTKLVGVSEEFEIA